LNHRLEQNDARTFGAGHRASDIEIGARKQRIEILKARDEARDFRKALLDQFSITVAERDECPVDLAAPPELIAAPFKPWSRRRAQLELEPVIAKHVQAADIVRGSPAFHRMHAAAVVADHPAQRVVVVSCRIGPEHEAVRPHRFLQMIENAAGLDPGGARLEIHFEHVMEMS
jgi:hypothetical protein